MNNILDILAKCKVKRRLPVILIIALLSTVVFLTAACQKAHRDDTAAPPQKSTQIAEQTPKESTVLDNATSQNQGDAKVEQEPQDSAASDIMLPAYTPTVRDGYVVYTREELIEFLFMTKHEMIQVFGSEYEIVNVGAEGLLDGYYFKDANLTFCFGEMDSQYDDVWVFSDDTAVFINVAAENEPLVEVDGIRIGRADYNQITDLWGQAEITTIYFEEYYPIEFINYEFEGIEFSFRYEFDAAYGSDEIIFLSVSKING